VARHELTDTSDQDAQLSVAESILQSLLLSDYKLELNAQARMLSLLNTHAPHILAQQQFTRNEWSILLTLLSSPTTPLTRSSLQVLRRFLLLIAIKGYRKPKSQGQGP